MQRPSENKIIPKISGNTVIFVVQATYKWLFFATLITCSYCRQILMCLIFVGQATHENLSYEDLFFYGTPCIVHVHVQGFEKLNCSVRNYQFTSTQFQCTCVQLATTLLKLLNSMKYFKN